jgi:hypothetical protein
MAVDILLLFGAKDGNAQPDPAFLEAGKRPLTSSLATQNPTPLNEEIAEFHDHFVVDTVMQLG